MFTNFFLSVHPHGINLHLTIDIVSSYFLRTITDDVNALPTSEYVGVIFSNFNFHNITLRARGSK